MQEEKQNYRVQVSKSDGKCARCLDPIRKGDAVVRTERGVLHQRCKERHASLLSGPAAAEKLGISPAQFRDLVLRLNLAPEDFYKNPHYKTGPLCPLYAPELIEMLASHEMVTGMRERSEKARAARAQKKVERAGRFEGQYPAWKAALPACAEALFSLNRYAKWARCAPGHRREIYALKNRFVRLLYLQGLAVRVVEHRVAREGLICWSCDGAGCEDCDGSGYYRGPDELVYIAFTFVIDGKSYAWHQPRRLVDWRFELTSGESGAQEWQPDPLSEKPIEMAPRAFAEAKALIEYVLQKAGLLPKG